MEKTQQAFSLKEAARLLGCHRETLRRLIKRGRLRARKVGRDYRVSRIDLEEYFGQAGAKLFEE